MQTYNRYSNNLFRGRILNNVNNELPHFTKLFNIAKLEFLHGDIENPKDLDDLLSFWSCVHVIEEQAHQVVCWVQDHLMGESFVVVVNYAEDAT
jgi:hypothetical protein